MQLNQKKAHTQEKKSKKRLMANKMKKIIDVEEFFSTCIRKSTQKMDYISITNVLVSVEMIHECIASTIQPVFFLFLFFIIVGIAAKNKEQTNQVQKVFPIKVNSLK